MSLYDRYRGIDDAGNLVEKLGIWPTITDFGRMLDGEITATDISQAYGLSAAEQQEFDAVNAHATSTITAYVVGLMGVGISQATATSIARGIVRNQYTQALLKAEGNLGTKAEFDAAMGIS